MRRNKYELILVAAAGLLLAGVVYAQEQEAGERPMELAEQLTVEAQEAEGMADEGGGEVVVVEEEQGDEEVESVPLLVTVSGLQGLVQYRVEEDGAWQKPELGMELPVGVEFRTGPRSAVRLTIPPDQSITLDRLGTVKVLAAMFDAEESKVKTDVGMKYGRATYEVEAAGVEHDSKIHSPGATLAIRGTEKVTLFDQGQRTIVATATGTRTTFTSGHVSMVFGQGQQAAVTPKSKSAAEEGRRSASQGDGMGLALTDAEQQLIVQATTGNKRQQGIGTRLIDFSAYGKNQFTSKMIAEGRGENPEPPDRVLGDLDGNGIVHGIDHGIMCDHYGMEGDVVYEQGDLDENGSINLLDLVTLSENYAFYREDLRVTSKGGWAFTDTNGDGKVNDVDLATVQQYYGKATDGGVGAGDFNDDGNVNLLDLVQLGEFYVPRPVGKRNGGVGKVEGVVAQ